MTGLPTNTQEADDFYDEAPAEEVETKEEEVVARASAAETLTELHAEIQTLKRLETLAQKVRQSDTDRKWKGCQIFYELKNCLTYKGIAINSLSLQNIATRSVI